MRNRGYSLIEVLVSFAILAVVIAGFLSLFDSSVKISKAQSSLSDVQENLRYVMSSVVRMIRMAGAGGIPVIVPGIATEARLGGLSVLDNVGVGANPRPTFGGRQPIVGTDVIELRGAFTGEVFDILQTAGGNYTYDVASSTGTVTIPTTSVSGETQNTADLEVRIDKTTSPPLWVPVVFSARSSAQLTLDGGHYRDYVVYGVAAMVDKDPSTRTYTFTTAATQSSMQPFLDLNPSGFYPSGLAAVNMNRVAVINDIVFFVGNDPDGVPTLYQYDRVTDQADPVASDVVDLQVELGCDINADGVITTVGQAAGDDEWQFNFAGEASDDRVSADPNSAYRVGYLHEVAVTLASRTSAADPRWNQPGNGTGSRKGQLFFADGRDLLADGPYRSVPVTQFRHRWLTERILVRSLGPIRSGA